MPHPDLYDIRVQAWTIRQERVTTSPEPLGLGGLETVNVKVIIDTDQEHLQ
jgi:hypothetical protein